MKVKVGDKVLYSNLDDEYASSMTEFCKRADIVIFEEERPTTEYIIVELKKAKENNADIILANLTAKSLICACKNSIRSTSHWKKKVLPICLYLLLLFS